MREHIDRLYSLNIIFFMKESKIPSLSRRITAHIHNAFRGSIKNHFNDIIVHTCSWGINYHYIRTPMLRDEIRSQNILHVTGIKFSIFQFVDRGIDFCILDCFRNIFNSYDMADIWSDETSDGPLCLYTSHRPVHYPSVLQNLAQRCKVDMPVVNLSGKMTLVRF